MKPISSFFSFSLLLAFEMLSGFYSCETQTKNLPFDNINLVASTPGDEQIKSILAISPDKIVDFIRWDFHLTGTKSGKQIFALTITYGESQPNTTGFKNGGEKKSIEGKYSITNDNRYINGEIYHLKSAQLPTEILMVKLSDNLFHLLTPQNHLMIGNGGWSYTLNRKDPLTHVSENLPALRILKDMPEDTARQIIFDGRTPCLDFAKENNLTVAPDCIKLKWKLILNKDPQTLQPTTYTLHRTTNRESDITGKWTIINGMPLNPQAVIYQLDPDKPEQSVFLLLGDENVAFFLDKDKQLFIGNENFSYTLNKRQKQ